MKSPNKVDLYLEAHVTIEPVFDVERERAKEVAKKYGFKLAHLIMQKERKATEKRSDRDTFMTGHSKYCDDISDRTKSLVKDPIGSGFKVWRYKIENTVLDSRNLDIWNLVDKDTPDLPFLMCDQCARAE